MTIYQISSINVCKKASAQNRAKALNFIRFLNTDVSRAVLFPLDGAGGFGGYVVYYSVYMVNLVYNSV